MSRLDDFFKRQENKRKARETGAAARREAARAGALGAGSPGVTLIPVAVSW